MKPRTGEGEGMLQRELTARQGAILEHVQRYRITTPEITALLFSLSYAEAQELLIALRDAGALDGPRPCFEGMHYFELNPAAFPDAGERTSRRLLSSTALVKAYGSLMFCCLGERPRQKVLRREFREAFPELCHKGLPACDYYIEIGVEGTCLLGLLYVESGQLPERIIRRSREMLERRLDILGFKQLLQEERFAYTIVTSDVEKAAKIRKGFEKRSLGLVPQIVVVADLQRFQESCK